jgi:hypothetical protein
MSDVAVALPLVRRTTRRSARGSIFRLMADMTRVEAKPMIQRCTAVGFRGE